MKKWFVALLILVVALASVYLIIPSKLKISRATSMKIPAPAALRSVQPHAAWGQWWTGTKDEKSNHFELNDVVFEPAAATGTGTAVRIINGDDTLTGILTVHPLKRDSTLVQFVTQSILPNNPIGRLAGRSEASKISNAMDSVLAAINRHLNDPKKVYELDVLKTKVRDSFLITTRFVTTGWPSTNDVYAQINTLKQYVSSVGAKETNHPMMNTVPLGNNQFETQVAIPIDRGISNKGEIFLKRMVNGNILEAEVKGGNHTVQQARLQLDNYISDYGLVPPAIPFALLVTDRQQEPDTSKWVTRLYYPIF